MSGAKTLPNEYTVNFRVGLTTQSPETQVVKMFVADVS